MGTILMGDVRPEAGTERSPGERIADIGFRLAVAGIARCPLPERTVGLEFQHLDQFEAADRPGLIQAFHFDLGPAVFAVARDSPAEYAGIRRGDILLAIDAAALRGPNRLNQPFDQKLARATSDRIDDELDLASARGMIQLQILRGDQRLAFAVKPVSSCPSRIHLARSKQLNAYADGTHVTVTTGLLQTLHSDDELAFVLAHEMAHNILQHAALLRAQGVPRHGLKRVLGKNGRAVRATEREADLLGGRLLLDAHYDLATAANVLKSFDEGFSIAFLSSHDTTGHRIAALRALAARPGVTAGSQSRE